jgi:hypothetical protein
MLRDLVVVVAASLGLSGALAAPARSATLFAEMFPLTGEIRLENRNATSPVPIVFYSIKSDAAALNGSPVRWLSVTEHYDSPFGATPGNGFIDANGAWVKLSSTSKELAEGALDVDGGSLAPQRAISLGRIWNPAAAATSDLVFAAHEPSGQPISVFTLFAIDGDYNGDGVVNQLDYNTWRKFYGATSVLQADGNLDGVVDAADYLVWRNNMGASLSGLASGASSGIASLALVGSAVVPEPAGIGMLACWLGCLLACRRRGSQRPRYCSRSITAC